MNTTGKYLKPGNKCTTPGVVFSIAVEKKPLGKPTKHGHQDYVFARAVGTISKKSGGKWSVPKIECFSREIDVIMWLMKNADKRKRNYIVCQCASDVLTLSKWWYYAEAKGICFIPDKARTQANRDGDTLADLFDVRRIVLRGKLDIFDYSYLGIRYVWLSLSNFLECSIEVLSRSVLSTIPRKLCNFADNSGVYAQAAYEAIIVGHTFRLLCDWWKEHAKAAFGLTIGQLSMGMLKTYVKPKTLCTHKDSESHKLERLACYGGRASVWYVGNIGDGYSSSIDRSQGMGSFTSNSLAGPITHVDIRSMYPSLLRDRTFPCTFYKRTGELSVKVLRELMELYGCIATVTIWSESGEFPLRTDKALIFPRGRFTTVLAGPDLEAISGKDHILKVHNASFYTMGRPYKETAQFLLAARMKARADKDDAWELFAKTLGNSLGGKLAQRKTMMVERRDHLAEMQWGEWVSLDYETMQHRRYKSIAGMVFEICQDERGEGPYTASFAYLTAYGRQLMRSIRQHIEPYSCISQDTDGIWLLNSSVPQLVSSGISFGNSPLDLRIVEVSNNGRFFGPKHYYVDSGWKLAGFHNPIVFGTGTQVTDYVKNNPITNTARTTPSRITEIHRTSFLKFDESIGDVSPDGWIRSKYIDTVTDIPI